MELRLLLCLTLFSVSLNGGQGRPSTVPRTSNPIMAPRYLRPQINDKPSNGRSQRPAADRRWSSSPAVTNNNNNHPGSALQSAAGSLNLASMVKNLMKDKWSAKKVILLPGRVYMPPPEMALKGRRRYGNAAMINKGYKYGGHQLYNEADGNEAGNYNEDDGENYLEGDIGSSYEGDGNYGDGYNDDSAGYADDENNNGDNGEGYAGGPSTEGYGQNEGYTEDENSGNDENGHEGEYNSGEQGYNNNAQMNIGGDVPSNDIGPGAAGQYNVMNDGEQFKANYDTLFREFVLNFFIKKYHLKTELPP